MPQIEREIRGVTYGVDAGLLDAAVTAFDITRDGLGQFSGVLGRAAFLHLTARITDRLVKEDAKDPLARWRFLKVFRSVLASRGRSAPCKSAAESEPEDQSEMFS